MLASGEAPVGHRPHLMTLLDETPRKTMQHMARWADELHSYRAAW
jgi:hypothetical protein